MANETSLPEDGWQDDLALAEMEEAFDELHGCIIRRPGDCCEVRKEFLAVALTALDRAVRQARPTIEDEPLPNWDDENDRSRRPWDRRPQPGRTNDDPMCVNYYCPSAFSCRRFSQNPWQGESGPTVFIDPKPTLLGGRLCKDFDPDCPLPSCDSNSDPTGGDALAAPGEASQSGGTEGAASPNPLINQETPHAR